MNLILHHVIWTNHKLKFALLYVRPNTLISMAQNGGDYDAFIFITYPGASGVAIGGKACPYEQRGHKISYNKAYGGNDCNKYQPPQWIRCTVTNRIALTSEVIITYNMWEKFIPYKYGG